MKQIKKSQGIFWSKDVSTLDFKKDKEYIIHQILQYGSLDQINWLKSIYSKDEIRKIFVKNPKKIYDPRSFNFIRHYLLNIKENLDSSKYVKTFS